MAYLEWTQALKVGHPQMDEEHLALLAVLNRLEAALEQGQDRQEIQRVLVFLRGYTVRHFEVEEAMMIKHHFPGTPAHFAAHAELVLQVSDLIADYRLDREVNADKVLAFLKAWLMNHILGMDQELGRFLKARGAAA